MALGNKDLTAQEAKEIALELKQAWEPAHKEWAEEEKIYEQENEIWESDALKPRGTVYMPTATAIVNTARDAEMSYSFQVSRQSAGRGKSHEELADEVEPWLQGALEAAAILENPMAFKALGGYLVFPGYVVIGAFLDQSEKPEEPNKEGRRGWAWVDAQKAYERERKAWFPFRIKCPPPHEVLMDPFDRRPDIAIWEYEMYAGELHDLSVDKVENLKRSGVVYPLKGNRYERIAVQEIWSRRQHMIAAEGKEVFTEENPYGIQPWTHGYSGWGSLPASGKRDPKMLARSVLTPLRKAIIHEEQLETAKLSVVMRQAFARRGVRENAAAWANQMTQAGRLLEGDPNDLWVEPTPEVGPAIFQAGEELRGAMEFASFSKAVGGHKIEGVSTVGQQAQIDTRANRKFSHPMQVQEELSTITGSNLLREWEVLGEEITVRGITLSPKALEGDYNCKVKFPNIDPYLQLQQMQLGLSMVDKGGMSWETFWSGYARLEDATGEWRRLLKQWVRKQPAVWMAMAAEVASEEGLTEATKQLKDSAQAARLALPGPQPGNPSDLAGGQGGVGGVVAPMGTQAASQQAMTAMATQGMGA